MVRQRKEKKIRTVDVIRREGQNSVRNQMGLESLWKITTKLSWGE